MFSIKRMLMGLIALFAVIQLIPVQRTNPPEGDPIVFTNPQAAAIAQRACYACHANEETESGETGGANGGAAELIDEVAESMQKGEMPPSYYYLTHYAAATMTTEEQAILVQGMRDALAGR